MTNNPIRVGLIGASIDPVKSWGTRAHIPALRHLPDFTLSAICTSSPQTATAAAAHFGVPLAFSDPREMAAHPEVDAVAVSVRTPLHGQMVAAALDAGKHVYCEWPLGVTTEEAAATSAAAQRAGVVHMIGLQGRGNEGVAYARDLIAEGYIGRVVSVTVKVTQENYGPRETVANSYTSDVRNGATILRIAAGQALEAICAGVGQLREFSAVVSNQHPEAVLVDGQGSIEKTSPDQVLISGILEGGAVISFHLRGGASPASGEARFEINGTEGDLLMLSAGSATIHRAPLTVYGAKFGDKSWTHMPIPERYGLQPPGLADGPPRYLAHNLVAFAKAIRGEQQVLLDFPYAVRWQAFLDAIQKASDTGMRQTFAG